MHEALAHNSQVLRLSIDAAGSENEAGHGEHGESRQDRERGEVP